MTTDHLIHRKNVRGALKHLDPKQLRELAEEPLAGLGAVEARRLAEGHAATAEGRARALRDLMFEALSALKPADAGEPDYADPTWRHYLILTEQYLNGENPWRLAERMIIGRDTYNHSQADALDAVSRWLRIVNEGVEVATPRPPVFNAPSSPSAKLIGREPVLNDLRLRLMAGETLALYGLPGVGKSTVAATIANDPHLLDHFHDGVLWAGLGQMGDAFAWLGEWAALLGVPRSELAYMSAMEARANAVHSAIATRRMLLVIDDVWNSDSALALRVGGPNCAHLLTTRTATVAIDFAGSNAQPLPELDVHSGLALLVHHAPDAVAYEPEAARSLAEAVGGLPLALTLMGRHLHRAGRGGQERRLRDALEELQQAEARLALTNREAPHERKPDLPAEASLEAVIGLSEALLDEPARQAWYALSVFPPKPNTFSEEAALAVAAEPPEVLDALVDAGVLEVEEGRYALHPMLRDYGRLRNLYGGPGQRLVNFYVGLVSLYSEDYRVLNLDHNNILRAIDQANEDDARLQFIDLAIGIFPFLEDRGLENQAKLDLEKARSFCKHLSEDRTATLVSIYLGRSLWHQGDQQLSENLFKEALTTAGVLGEDYLCAMALEGLATVANDTGRRRQALDWCRQGEILAERSGKGNLRIRFAALKASIAALDANYEEAKSILDNELEKTRGTYDLASRVRLLASQGIMTFWLGDALRANRNFSEALAISRSANLHETLIGSLALLGWYFR